MPIYEYECVKCGHRFEKIQGFSDPPVKRCPECKANKAERLIGAPAVHFKGSGWYINDSKGSNAASKTTTTTESTSTETKETKTETKAAKKETATKS